MYLCVCSSILWTCHSGHWWTLRMRWVLLGTHTTSGNIVGYWFTNVLYTTSLFSCMLTPLRTQKQWLWRLSHNEVWSRCSVMPVVCVLQYSYSFADEYSAIDYQRWGPVSQSTTDVHWLLRHVPASSLLVCYVIVAPSTLLEYAILAWSMFLLYCSFVSSFSKDLLTQCLAFSSQILYWKSILNNNLCAACSMWN